MICIIFTSLLLILICCVTVLLASSGDVWRLVLLILGVSGLLGLASILCNSVFTRLKQRRSDSKTQTDKLREEYILLVDQAEAHPVMFARKLRLLCYLGNIYAILLVVLQLYL